MALVETRYAVPGWGVGGLWLDGNVVHAHDFDFEPGLRAAPREGARVPPNSTVAANPSRDGDGFVPRSHERRSGERESPTADALIERFDAFLAGEPVGFGDVVLDLEWATPLQRSIAGALRAVPRGEVVSYGELAALAGCPRAPRAAGAFCAANRFAFVLPCHRVVAAGGIGGYGDAGVEVKRRLLALEGVVL